MKKRMWRYEPQRQQETTWEGVYSQYNNAGCDHCIDGDFQRGILSFQKAVSLLKKNRKKIENFLHIEKSSGQRSHPLFFALCNLGQAYKLNGQNLIAYRYYIEAWTYSPSFRTARESLLSFLKNIFVKPIKAQGLPTDLQKLLLLGRAATFVNSMKRAARYFTSSLSKTSSFLTSAIWLDFFKSIASRHSSVVKESEKIATIDSLSSLADSQSPELRVKALEMVRLGKGREAIEQLSHYLSRNPNASNVWGLRGDLLDQENSPLEATSSFQRALIIAPENHSYQQSLKTLANKIIRQLESEAISLHGMPFFNPSKHLDWLLLANILLKSKKYLEAIVSFRQLLKLNSLHYESWYKTGLAYYSEGYYEQAIESFDKAISIKPIYYEAFYQKGVCLCQIGQYESAISCFDEVLKINANSYDSMEQKGIALYQLERFEDAISIFDEVLPYKPDKSIVLHHRGNAKKSIGSYAQAKEDFNRCLFLTNEEFWPAWKDLGWVEFKEGQHQKAFDLWRKGLEKYSEPEALGAFHYSIGLAQIQQLEQRSRKYKKQNMIQARDSFQTAIEKLTSAEFYYQKLQILKDLMLLKHQIIDIESERNVRVKISIEIEALAKEGESLLAALLYQTPSRGKQLQFLLEFLSFNQIRVDGLAQSANLADRIKALELAEKHKNLCLYYSRSGHSDTAGANLSYSDIQRFLSHDTCLLYWHISPVQITTFVVKPEGSLIVYIGGRVNNKWSRFVQKLRLTLTPKLSQFQLRGFTYPEDTTQIRKFESWVKAWKLSYERYRFGEREEWKNDMQGSLQELGEILGISRLKRLLNKDKTIKKLLLVLHRDLHLLPTHTFFSSNFSATHLPSIQAGLLLIPNKCTSRVKKIFIVENPTEDLPGTVIEACIIRQASKLHGNSVYSVSGQAATPEEIFSTLARDREIRVLHFAGHGQFNSVEPLRSALKLSGEKILLSGEKSLRDEITLQDVFTWPCFFRDLRLVCLSSCETGITGQKELVNDFVGLVNGFLSSGTTSVISSLWKVDDIATFLLIGKFYECWLSSPNSDVGTVAFSLNAAQTWLRKMTVEELDEVSLDLKPSLRPGVYKTFKKRIENIKKHSSQISRKPGEMYYPFSKPFFWAAFIVTGL